MPYLLDSDWVIDLLADNRDALLVLDRLTPDGLSMSVVSYMEAYQGTLREPDPAASEARLHVLVASVSVLPLTPAVARRCARIREVLRQQGRRVGSRALDLIIAATALESGLTLVTRNLRDYRDVPGLVLYSSG
jgi:predicted nucleic acid-binding protein